MRAPPLSRLAWAFALLALGVGCSKGSEKEPLSTGSRVLPGSVVDPSGVVAVPTDTTTTPTSPTPHQALEYDGAPVFYTVTETVDANSIRVDPDIAVVQAARASGAGCFAGLQGGPDVRSGVMQVTVIPTGSVSRTEVAGDPDPGVRDCLRRVGDGLHFSAKDDSKGEGIRSFSIDVTVSRPH
jgi:hypothetical protein